MKGHNKKIPRVIKKLKGTYQPCRDTSDAELPITLSNLPPAPGNLKAEGLIYYREQGNKLLSLGLVNEYNLILFVSICLLITKVEFLARKMNASKSTSDISLYGRLYLQFQQSLRISMSEFGLTPASISKIHIPKKEEPKPFDEFMNGK